MASSECYLCEDVVISAFDFVVVDLGGPLANDSSDPRVTADCITQVPFDTHLFFDQVIIVLIHHRLITARIMHGDREIAYDCMTYYTRLHELDCPARGMLVVKQWNGDRAINVSDQVR